MKAFIIIIIVLYIIILSSTISRVMYQTIIYLVLLLPAGSSDLPKSMTGSHIAFVLVLLRMGFTQPLPLPAVRQSLTLPFHPYHDWHGGIFLLHWPWSHLHRTLSGILPYEARTFLTCGLTTLAAAIVCATQHLFDYTIL